MTTKQQQPKLVFVDDESSVLKSLERIFFDTEYEITTFQSPQEALEQIHALEPDIVVSDQMMPGMKGVDFLEQAFERAPLSNFIMLTAFPEYELVTQALNNGNICKFLTKPWQADEFRGLIESVLEQRRRDLMMNGVTGDDEASRQELQQKIDLLKNKVKQRIQTIMGKNHELYRANFALERNLWDTIRIFFGLLKEKSDLVGDHSVRVSKLVRSFAMFIQLPQDQIIDIEIAALLHDIGKISLPESIVSRIGQNLHKEDEELLSLHPLIGQYAFYSIKPMAKIGAYIRHHHERWDGSGFPDGLNGDQIPLPVQILQVCNTFDNIKSRQSKLHNSQKSSILETLKAKAGNVLSPECTAKFIMFLNELKEMRAVDNLGDEKEPYDLEKLVDMAILQVTDEFNQIAYNDVRIVRHFEDIPLAVIQPKLIKSMFIQTLRNAIEAITGKGTVTITMKISGDSIEIKIDDTGIGIEEKMVQKVFQPGFSTKKDKKHLGEGLTDVYDSLRAHKGRVEINSVVGKGTSFIVYIPMK
ncbi:MAG: response regulator [FCB group bacterium]|nr:response regulator [FCB group bacterium]